MSERKQIHQEFLTGERALIASNDLDIYDTIFDDGESPLKESHGISLTGCFYRWKYGRYGKPCYAGTEGIC